MSYLVKRGVSKIEVPHALQYLLQGYLIKGYLIKGSPLIACDKSLIIVACLFRRIDTCLF